MENLCYHSHNFLCDGQNPLEDYIQEAINQDVIHFGFSSHSPLFFENKWSLLEGDLDIYQKEIHLLQKKYDQKIRIFKSLEIDYIPGFSHPNSYFQSLLDLDYQIGSVHLVISDKKEKLWFIDGPREGYINGIKELFNGDVQKAVTQFFKQSQDMIIETRPDIIGHFDKVVMNNQEELFSCNDDWYKKMVFDTLRIISKYKTIVEVNTRGIYRGKWKFTFPSPSILKECFNMNIPVVISSDAHHPSEITANYTQAKELLLSIGYRYQMKKTDYGWTKSAL